MLLIQNDDANGDPVPAPGAERADERRVGSAGEVEVLPHPGLGIPACRGQSAVEEGLEHPRIAADGRAAVAVPPPSLVLDVEDRANQDNTDTERVAPAPAPAAVSEVLADHERLPNIERAVRCRTEGPRSASAARSARSCSTSGGVSSA
jgi:hypothetical protein